MTKLPRAVLIAACLALPPAGVAEPGKAADLKSLASATGGYRWEFPCKGPLPDKPKEGADCASVGVAEAK